MKILSLKEHALVVAGDSSRMSSQFCWQPGDVSPVGNFWEDANSNSLHRLVSRTDPIRQEHIQNYPSSHEIHPMELHNQIAHRLSTYGGYDPKWQKYGTYTPSQLAHASYKGGSNETFNLQLRNAANHHEDGSIHLHRVSQSYNHPVENFKSMDRVTSHPTIKPMSLYRGFGDRFDAKNLKSGQEFVDHGYTGLSRHMGTSLGFTAGNSYDAHPHDPIHNSRTMAMVHVPAGSMGHLLDHPREMYSPLNDEGEFVLHRGTKFRVMGHSLAAGNHSDMRGHGAMRVHMVHLQVTGQHPKPLTPGREASSAEPEFVHKEQHDGQSAADYHKMSGGQ